MIKFITTFFFLTLLTVLTFSQNWSKNTQIDSSVYRARSIHMVKNDNGNVQSVFGYYKNSVFDFHVNVKEHNITTGESVNNFHVSLRQNFFFNNMDIIGVQSLGQNLDIFYKNQDSIFIARINNQTLTSTFKHINEGILNIGSDIPKINQNYYLATRQTNSTKIYKIDASNLSFVDSISFSSDDVNDYLASYGPPNDVEFNFLNIYIKVESGNLWVCSPGDTESKILQLDENLNVINDYTVQDNGFVSGFDVSGNNLYYSFSGGSQNLYKTDHNNSLSSNYPVALEIDSVKFLDYNHYSNALLVDSYNSVHIFDMNQMVLNDQNIIHERRYNYCQIDSSLYYLDYSKHFMSDAQDYLNSFYKWEKQFDFSVWHGLYRLYTENLENKITPGYLAFNGVNSTQGLSYNYSNVYKTITYLNLFHIGAIDEDTDDTLWNKGYLLPNRNYGMLGASGNPLGDSISIKYQRQFAVTKDMIDHHVANFTDPNYVVPSAIKNWPAHGDPNQGQDFYLASFYDNPNGPNGANGIYDPIVDGDYPKIKGDKAVFSITGLNLGEADANLPIELHTMLYYYECNDVLKDVIFASVRVINRSNINMKQVRAGVLSDFDIGGPTDDYAQTNVELNMVFGFNGDNNDQDFGGMPGMNSDFTSSGTIVLRGVPAKPDMTDNGIGTGSGEFPYGGYGFGNGVDDDEIYGMNGSRVFVNPGSNPPAFMNTSIYEYSGLQLYKNGGGFSPIVSDTLVNYIYPSLSDPQNYGSDGISVGDWTEPNALNPIGDRRMYAFSDSGYLAANDEFEMEFAFIAGHDDQDPSVQGSVNQLIVNATEINQYYEDGVTPCGQPFGYYESSAKIEEHKNIEMKVYPNPTKSYCIIESNTKLQSVQVYDFQGREVFQKTSFKDKSIMLYTQDLQAGVYVLVIKTDDGDVQTEKLIVTQ